MTDAQGKLIPPGAFIPAAERYHQMNAIDRWVIQHVFNTLRRTEPAKCPGLYSINISGQSLGDPRFLDFVIHQLQKTDIAPEQICFEITETAAIANLAEARRFIVELRQRRCRFALDDFGSGLSSFAYLKTLSVDYLKIDGIFVRDMATDPIDCSIVTAVNQIGQQMGMQTIAEFVENSAILAKLRGIGVNFAQGFGLSRPRPLTLMAADGVGMVCEQSDRQV
jgi:EAL domain-containing protein (putative c-di-GMP-specific phosphodiesterase class I)